MATTSLRKQLNEALLSLRAAAADGKLGKDIDKAIEKVEVFKAETYKRMASAEPNELGQIVKEAVETAKTFAGEAKLEGRSYAPSLNKENPVTGKPDIGNIPSDAGLDPDDLDTRKALDLDHAITAPKIKSFQKAVINEYNKISHPEIIGKYSFDKIIPIITPTVDGTGKIIDVANSTANQLLDLGAIATKDTALSEASAQVKALLRNPDQIPESLTDQTALAKKLLSPANPNRDLLLEGKVIRRFIAEQAEALGLPGNAALRSTTHLEKDLEKAASASIKSNKGGIETVVTGLARETPKEVPLDLLSSSQTSLVEDPSKWVNPLQAVQDRKINERIAANLQPELLAADRAGRNRISHPGEVPRKGVSKFIQQFGKNPLVRGSEISEANRIANAIPSAIEYNKRINPLFGAGISSPEIRRTPGQVPPDIISNPLPKRPPGGFPLSFTRESLLKGAAKTIKESIGKRAAAREVQDKAVQTAMAGLEGAAGGSTISKILKGIGGFVGSGVKESLTQMGKPGLRNVVGGAAKFAGGTFPGALLASMAGGSLVKGIGQMALANQMSQAIPMEGILNAQLADDIRRRRLMESLQDNPKMMSAFQRQLEGVRMIETGRKPGDVVFGGSPSEGPFQNPSELMSFLEGK